MERGGSVAFRNGVRFRLISGHIGLAAAGAVLVWFPAMTELAHVRLDQRLDLLRIDLAGTIVINLWDDNEVSVLVVARQLCHSRRHTFGTARRKISL